MLLLTATTDKLQLVTGTAADVDVHVSYMDASNANPPVVQGDTMGRQNTAITTATTTDILAAPAASEVRNCKTIHVFNKDTADSTDVTVIFDQNATDFTLFKCNLAPGEGMEYVEGIGFFEIAASPEATVGTNKSTASQALSTSEVYLTGSAVPLAGLGTPVVGTFYDCSFDVVKTAGTGAMLVRVRVGTLGTTGDTERLLFTMDAGTSAADTAVFVVRCMFRAVGASAVLQGRVSMVNSGPTATGFRDASPTLGVMQVTSGTFDSTVANSIIGVTFNGQTAFAGTVQLVEAELVKR